MDIECFLAIACLFATKFATLARSLALLACASLLPPKSQQARQATSKQEEASEQAGKPIGKKEAASEQARKPIGKKKKKKKHLLD